jgi:CO/xanthine dehydrogenase FAD-binding subunit
VTPFAYARPRTLAQAVALMEEHGPDVRLLSGGTDLLIALRNHAVEPRVVIDLKRVEELQPTIDEDGDKLSITASVVMTDIVEDARIQTYFPALAEAAVVVGSVQIRNRATLAGNICNCSPAADTAPPLLVYHATVVVAGRNERRRIPIDDFIRGPGETALEPGELVTAIELPIPKGPYGAAFTRLARRRGTDLASITLCCGVDPQGVTRLSYGSVGPRPLLVVDESGVLADRTAPEDRRAAVLDRMFVDASPAPAFFYRAGPEYRLAMLRVLGRRALEVAIDRLDGMGIR